VSVFARKVVFYGAAVVLAFLVVLVIRLTDPSVEVAYALMVVVGLVFCAIGLPWALLRGGMK
jgi:hypothetical protein